MIEKVEVEEVEQKKEKAEIKNTEKTEILYGVDNIVKRAIGDFHKIRERLDNCIDSTGPSVFFKTPIWKDFIELKNRGIKLRFITEITKDNLDYSKELSKVAELRHLDGVKGNFGIADDIEYGCYASVKEGEPPIELIRSNVKTFVQQQKYFFETLWNKAILAHYRIKEIEEGISPNRTRILASQNEIIKEIENLNNSADHLSICSGLGGMQMSYNFFLDTYKNKFDKYRKKEVKEFYRLRWIIDINKDSIKLVKAFLELGFQIRHVKNMLPINFGVSDKEVALTIEKMEGGKMSSSFLISNEPSYVNHFNSLFEELWKNGIDATERIKDIEAGVDLADIEVISSSLRAQDRYLDIVKAASEEILWIFPTTNAFIRQDKIGAIPLAKETAKEKNIRIKILIPASTLIEQKALELKEYRCPANTIEVRYIVQMSETKATILVVDRKISLVMELKDDTKSTFYEAIGLSTYSNSKAGALSYVAIFENLWKQSELYEQLMKAHEQVKIHDKMQKEFINIAAHELRTPIQPIISLSEIVLYNTKDIEQAKLLEVINRNAKRLHRLTEDILDVTKIESQSLNLNKEQFNLKNVITNAIDDIMTNKVFLSSKTNNDSIKILYHQLQDVFVYADKGRINQVISNLLDNAVKFTNGEGTITVMIEKEEQNEKHNNQQQIIVSIKDTGTGIDPQIMPRLFTKFATKSQIGGTGLGLFISKGIIEAHGGNLWAENNIDGKGATFSFSLLITN